MSHDHDSELESPAKAKVEPTGRKSPGKAKKRVVARPKLVVSKLTIRRPKKSADETKSKRIGSKVQRKKSTSPRLVRRTKRGKGNRRRRRERKSGEGGVVGSREELAEEEDLKETGAGCYCSQLKEGVREEGEARGNPPGRDENKCWVCRLREMSRKSKQLRGGRQ